MYMDISIVGELHANMFMFISFSFTFTELGGIPQRLVSIRNFANENISFYYHNFEDT